MFKILIVDPNDPFRRSLKKVLVNRFPLVDVQEYQQWQKSGKSSADYKEFQEWREFKAYQEWKKSQQ